MSESAKIIENGFVFTGDKQNQAGRLTLLIQNGRIMDIGKPVQLLKAHYPEAEVINASGKVLMPGFVDAHHTGESFILRYFTSDQPISKWNKIPSVNRILDYLRKQATYEEFLTLYRLSYYAALKSGVTSLAEYGIDNPENSFNAAHEAMRQVNVRGCIGLHNGDQIEAAQELQGTSVHFACVLEDEENLTIYNIQSTIRTAREFQWPIILHLGEDQRAHDVLKKNFKKSVLQLYSEYKIFDSPVQFIHLAGIEEGDFEIVSRCAKPLVFSPSAILQKDTALPPFKELINRRILLALGTDWGVPQPLENIQAYCSILRVLGLPVGGAYDLLAMHTKNSAQVLGLDREIGSLEIGKKADIVFLNLSDFRMSPLLAEGDAERILLGIMQEGRSHHVSEVMINGEFYVREGHLLTYSEEDLTIEGQAILNRLIHVGGESPQEGASSTPILQLPTQRSGEPEHTANDVPYEEGFRIVQKETESKTARVKKEIPQDSSYKDPKNVKKIFGDDDL